MDQLCVARLLKRLSIYFLKHFTRWPDRGRCRRSFLISRI